MSNAIELDDPDPMIAFSNRMRNRRFHHFEQLTESMPRPLKIIDVGGTTDFWVRRGWGGRSDIQITTVNRDAESKRCQNIEPVVGDASNLSGFADQSFDIAFSNSVIEHLEIWENQAAMACAVRRVGRAYYVQTPNYWFPMEPHFQILGWQWMPLWFRVAILRRRKCGFCAKTPDPAQARQIITEVRLLSCRELLRLFPDASIYVEKYAGFVKSWTAFGGFGASESDGGFHD